MMKQKLRLILPNKKYIISYLKAQKEFAKERPQSTTSLINRFEKPLNSPKDFLEYNKILIKNRKGTDLPKGRVPSTFYWAVIGNKVVGFVDLRHYLNENLRKMGGHIGYAVVPSQRKKGYGTEMLRLALLKAKGLGIKKALLTCDVTNVGSRKIIDANGGKLQDKIKKLGVSKLRYWIKI